MQRQRYIADFVVTCDALNTVFSPGVIDIESGEIVWVGSLGEEEKDISCEVNSVGGLLMPGLINSHCHTPMTLVRGAGDGLPLGRWLTDHMWPREGRMNEEDAYWGMTLGTAEMFRAGVTTSCEMYLFEEALVDSVSTSGARLVMTPGIMQTLHSDLGKTASNRIEDLLKFHALYNDPNGKITVGLGPHSAYVLGIPTCIELAEVARSLDALLHIHVSETRDESLEIESEYGASMVQVLADNGILEGKVLAAHCVWVSGEDISLLAELGVSVAHCPVSNMKLGSGIAPLSSMLDGGVNVALGTDGPASNDNLDLWEEVKVAALLARVASLDSTLITPATALGLATRQSAKAVGLEKVGILERGWKADMIRIDTDLSTFLPVTEINEMFAHLAWAGSSRKITDVWIEGSKVLSDGQLVTIDEERAIAEVKERSLKLIEGR